MDTQMYLVILWMEVWKRAIDIVYKDLDKL